ncbi:MAG: glycosyltransferase family 2 protein [Candidatus Omnitrophica bacterium]|nr:glycosyltransferase family 2 protein [Candidatus Omnitrophota bacterium]
MNSESINTIVSAVIVTAGLSQYLKECIYSLQNQSFGAVEIILIDNSLNPGFSRSIRQIYPEVKLHVNPENLYYCQAMNTGIDMSRGDFILCLNDDVILEKNFIQNALKGFEKHARIGMVSGKTLRLDKETIDTTGLFLSPWRTAKDRGYGSLDCGRYEKEGYVFGVNGAAAFYRKAMLEEVKIEGEYFDSDYNIFYEDLDIAWRAHNLGWRCFYVPAAVAYHARGQTVRRAEGIGKSKARLYLSNELNYDLIKNRCLTIIKNEKAMSFLLHLPFIFAYDIISLLYILIFRPAAFKRLLFAPLPLASSFRKRKKIFMKVNRKIA